MKPTIVDYIAIVFIAAGVVALGANDLYVRHGGEVSITADASTGSLIRELREDRSSELAEGVPVERLTARNQEQRRARYPWERTPTQAESGNSQSIFDRLGNIFTDKKIEQQKADR